MKTINLQDHLAFVRLAGALYEAKNFSAWSEVHSFIFKAEASIVIYNPTEGPKRCEDVAERLALQSKFTASDLELVKKVLNQANHFARRQLIIPAAERVVAKSLVTV